MIGRRLIDRRLAAVLLAGMAFGESIAAAQSDATSLKTDMLRVGVATASFQADDSMQIAGGMGPGRAVGQEGDLRAVAFVLERLGSERLAIVACDVLFVTREMIDKVAEQIQQSCGISPSHLLVNATHTHHAPSTVRIHGCEPEPEFVRSVEEGIVSAVEEATRRLTACRLQFALNEDVNVGKNSRMRLKDNTIYWIGPSPDALEPTGPFDSQMPVLSFRSADERLVGVLYNHSTHTIGTLSPKVRSPSFYGLAAQQLEQQWNAPVCFLEGASGSTHNLTHETTDALTVVKQAVSAGVEKGQPMAVNRLAAIKRPFRFKVRTFDEAMEDEKVSSYCQRRVPAVAEAYANIFRQMRLELQAEQGKERQTLLQAMLIDEVAIVGVPAEFFTGLGMEIKKRSPYQRTYIAELANDWIGYLPDREAHRLGGYQTWMGLHSYAEIGTGERVVDQMIDMLNELAK